MKKEFKELVKSTAEYYSDRAVVMKTYRTKDQLEDFNLGLTKVQYDPYKHLKCDVRLTKDGTMVYGVDLTPHLLSKDSNGNIQTIYDGTLENSTGDIPVTVPLVGSYVFINWLSENQARVAQITFTENIVVGSTEGAYFDFYNREDIRILDLKNADEFNIQLNNGKSFSVKTDKQDFTTFLVLLERIVLSITDAQIVIETIDNVPTIKIETDKGKISIKNDTENLLNILLDIVTQFESYINTVFTGLILADATLSTSLTQILNNLTKLKQSINNLFI